MNIKQTIRKIPVLGPLGFHLYRRWIKKSESFTDSEHYWKQRYESGGNSGYGSYDQLAVFKADVLNAFLAEHPIRSVIEFGCGDGNQMQFVKYPNYIGFDISPKAISLCRGLYPNDSSKSFKLLRDYTGERADLTLSLDVIYHLVEDEVFEDYMRKLFGSSEQFVIIYSSDTNENPDDTMRHIRHRKFSEWVALNGKDWKLDKHIPNKYPLQANGMRGSFADFFIYSRSI